MHLQLIGTHGSPYTMKMRALMRYRRIPFRFIPRGAPEAANLPPVPVPVIPVLVMRNEGDGPDEAMVDSTPLIKHLEARYAERRALPADPALALIDALLEDYADEWLTKPMFYYRWTFAADVHKASHVVLLDTALTMDAGYEKLAAAFGARQVERRSVVGAGDSSGEVMAASYERLLKPLSDLLTAQPFLMGGRPGASDFAFYGQLFQLTWYDPTPSAIAAERAPRVCAWVHRTDDLAWLEVADSDWSSRAQAEANLRPLLTEVGRTYAPFMLANLAALQSGQPEVVYSVDGVRCTQPPFKYQGKCLGWLRAQHAALSAADRDWIASQLAGTGCEPLFE